jgi:coenzyme F420-0:L-glutamate ligase / coenzyme F420-1:gamma-L-glutamate ligase
MRELRLRPLGPVPEIVPGDDLPAHVASLVPDGPGVLVVAQKIVSKAEGRIVALADVRASTEAEKLAAEVEKDPRIVELVLRESRRIVRKAPGVLICETHHGLVCANAGIDQSNAPGADHVVLLPVDPDRSARAIQARLGSGRAVIVSDTFGRPWRQGLVDVAIGVAGLTPILDCTDQVDRAGRPLRVTFMALADQLAAAAGMLMGKAAGHPLIWCEGVTPAGDGALADLLRSPERDLFR